MYNLEKNTLYQGLPGVGVYPGHPGVYPAGVETPADGVGVGVTG